MKPKASVVAQRLLNLYRQEHVIFGGWAAVNPVFVAESDDDVFDELMVLPTGATLVQHIKNLKNGKTPMNSIDPELMPYGGLMESGVETIILTGAQWNELTDAINKFTPDQAGLEKLQSTPIVRRFGDEWPVAIRTALAARPELLEKWAKITQTHRAYSLWNTASDMVNEPMSERARAEFQADMPEYETYLPMFGDAGEKLLGRLRQFITARDPIDTDNAPDAATSI